MLRTLTLTALLVTTAPVVAQTPAPMPQQAQAQAKPNPLDKIVCRYEDTLGSRLKRHKVCATVREWKDQEDDTRRAVERIQEGSGVVPSG